MRFPVLITTGAARFIALAFHLLVPFTTGFQENSVHSSTLVTSMTQLEGALNNFKLTVPIQDVGDDLVLFMSKIVVSDYEDLLARNLTIYSNTLFHGFTDDDYRVVHPVCEAYFGDVMCSECTLCAHYPNIPANPWSLTDGVVFFNCTGIGGLHSCVGATGSLSGDEFEPYPKCDGGSGLSTCFVENSTSETTPPNDDPDLSTRGTPSGGVPLMSNLNIMLFMCLCLLGWT